MRCQFRLRVERSRRWRRGRGNSTIFIQIVRTVAISQAKEGDVTQCDVRGSWSRGCKEAKRTGPHNGIRSTKRRNDAWEARKVALSAFTTM